MTTAPTNGTTHHADDTHDTNQDDHDHPDDSQPVSNTTPPSSSCRGENQTPLQDETTLVQEHYGHHQSAQSYQNAFFYSSTAYMDHVAQQLVPHWPSFPNNHNNDQKDSNFSLLDVGGGTGNFTRHLLSALPSSTTNKGARRRAVVVDPFLTPSVDTIKTNHQTHDNNNKDDEIVFVQASAQEFILPTEPPSALSSSSSSSSSCTSSSRMLPPPNSFQVVLLKEVVHHFPLKDCVSILEGLRKRLVSKGRLWIVTRPQYDLDYPLWPQALEVWAAHQPPVEVFVQALQQAGYESVQTMALTPYTCTMPLTTWQTMVQDQMWSTFAHFTADELQHAAQCTIPQLHAHRIHPVDGTIQFDDRLLLVTAQNP